MLDRQKEKRRKKVNPLKSMAALSEDMKACNPDYVDDFGSTTSLTSSAASESISKLTELCTYFPNVALRLATTSRRAISQMARARLNELKQAVLELVPSAYPH